MTCVTQVQETLSSLKQGQQKQGAMCMVLISWLAEKPEKKSKNKAR